MRSIENEDKEKVLQGQNGLKYCLMWYTIKYLGKKIE